MLRKFRFKTGRNLVYLGLRIMPRGKIRSELFQLLDIWSTKVTQTVQAKKRSKQTATKE